MDNTVIRTENLTCQFETVTAVENLNLEIPPGVIFGFLGPNGAGKTTTIRLLLGLLESTSGRAEVLGYDSRRRADEIRARSGALLEHTGLYERMSAEDNLDFYGRIWHLSATDRKIRIRELLTQLDLWDRRKEQVVKWSRGMKQKLAVARALLHRPSLLFLDEPTAGLDPVTASALRNDLSTLVKTEEMTVFLTTHNLSEAEKVCDLIAVIRSGKLIAMGAPHELKTRQGSPRIKITGRGISPKIVEQVQVMVEVVSVQLENGALQVELKDNAGASPLISLLTGAGVEIEGMSKGQVNLEEVFLTLMEENKT